MRLRLIAFVLPVAAGLLMSDCKKKEKDADTPTPAAPSPLPTVSTSAISQIDATSATGGGVVSAEGNSALTAVGICWDTDHNPTTLRPHTNAGAGTGSFSGSMTGLTANTTYYVRAYATNGSGTAYGNEVSFKTSDLWQKVTAANHSYILEMVSKGDVLFGYGDIDFNYSFYASTDEGKTWTERANGFPANNFYITSLVVKGSLLFAAVREDIYVSTNDGNSWTKISTLPNTFFVHLCVGPNGLYACGSNNNGVFVSTDNGATWTAINTGLTDLNIQTIAAGNSVLYAGSYDQGVFVSTNNGASWTAANTGINDLRIRDLAISGNNVLLAGEDGNYISTDHGSNWKKIDFGGAPYRVMAVQGNYVCANGNNGATFLSSDNGATWRIWTQGLTDNLGGVALSSTAAFGNSYNSAVYKRTLQ